MANVHWETFEGTHFQVGYKLGKYWVERLNGMKSNYGKLFLKKNPYERWLADDYWSKDHEHLGCTFSRHFPLLVEELNGMVQGARDAGCKVSFKSMFRLSLGEADGELHGCSTIAHKGTNEIILAHNEEEERRFPLCYARVRLLNESRDREFLTVSYPFQFFGSAVGANSTLAFTGNSIGMIKRRKNEIKHTLSGRVPKTVFSRLMLEEPHISGIERLLGRHHAILPSHWYIASRTRIASAQIRPRASVKHDAATQLSVSDIRPETSCHTNHFQKGRSASWSWSKSCTKESTNRLKRLETLAQELSRRADGSVSTSSFKKVLKKHRVQPPSGMKGTSATIILSVGQSETTVDAIDYFDGEPIRVGMEEIPHGIYQRRRRGR